MAGDNLVVSIDNLKRLVEQMYQLNVDVQEVPVGTIHTTSMVLRFADSNAVILLSSPLPDPERRFAVAKELMHLALDEREDWDVNVTGVLSELLMLNHMEFEGKSDHAPTAPVVCEKLAEFAAIEALYPYQHRVAAEKDETGEINFSTIAIRYKVPVRVVRLGLHQAYMDICREFLD